MTAEQAKNTTDKVRETLPLNNPVLSQMLQLIEEACEKGEDRFYLANIDPLDDPFAPQAFAHLQSLGYKVEQVEEYKKISWGQ